MEQYALDNISYVGHTYFYNVWNNKKIGAIADVEGNGIYRFIETTRDKNGNLIHVDDQYDKNPIVIVGILGYWLKFRENRNRLLRIFDKSSDAFKTIREQFDSYTEERYTQFKKNNRDNPDSWDWDWDYEFYGKFIIPNEIHLNKITEAIFDYLPDNENKIVCSLMSNYIKYLKHVRLEKGYKDIPILKVLRSIDSPNTDVLEDMEDNEIISILDSLEEKGYVKVAWVEGHTPEAIKLLNKGKLYLRELEAEERGILPSDEITDALSNVDKPERKIKDFTPIGQTFTKTAKVTELQLTLIMQRLTKANKLDPNGLADDWLKLFSGVNSMFTIKWLGTPGELRDLFKLLTKPKGKNKTGYVTPLYNYQQIVQSHFTDKNGEAFKPLKGQKSIDSFKPILDDCEFTLQFLTDNMTEVMKEIINNNEGALIEAGLSYNISASKNDDNLRIRNKR